MTNTMTLTITDVTPVQVAAIDALLTKLKEGKPGTLRALATKGKTVRGKRAPERTVSKDEDEDFGDEELDEEDLGATASDDPAEFEDEEEEKPKRATRKAKSKVEEDEDEEEESDDEDEDEDELNFDDVRDVMNKYGEKHPDQMKEILASFDVKSTKELERKPKKWAPVVAKVEARLKALKAKKRR